MKLYWFLLFICLVSKIYSQDISNSIVRDDNDYATFKDVQSPKEATPYKIIEKYKSILKDIDFDAQISQSYSYKISLNKEIDLYVLFVDCSFTKNSYVIAFNNKSSSISDMPISLNMKWAFNNESAFNYKLLTFPLIKIEQHDGNYTLFFKERVHDGNVYDAVIDKIYTLNKDMSFDLKFCYEEESITLDNNKLKRYVYNSIVTVYLDKDTTIEYLGKFEINIKTKTILQKECINNEYNQILFTGSGKEDEYILKNGFTIKY